MRKVLTMMLTVAMGIVAMGIVGCETQNPICTENFCVTGEVFPRSEIGDREFSEVDVDDSRLLAALASIPKPTAPVDKTVDNRLAEIVSDTAAGSTTYNGRFVSVPGEVEQNFTLDPDSSSEGLTLQSGNDKITFFVISWGVPDNLKGYQIGETYDFPVFIAKQSPSLVLNDAGDLVENEDREYNVWGHLALHGRDSEVVSSATLRADARVDNQRYQGRVVRVTDRVSSTTATSIHFSNFFIEKNGHPDENTMQVGQTYTVDVFIAQIGLSRFINLPQVRAYLVKDE